MDDAKFKTYADRLGLGAEMTTSELEGAWMRKSFAAESAGDEAGREQIRQVYLALKPGDDLTGVSEKVAESAPP